MPTDFNSTFGGVGQEPSPNAINIDKKPGSFFAEFGGKGQDISRHAIPPVPRIGSDYSNSIPSRGINYSGPPTAILDIEPAATAPIKYPFTPTISGTSLTLTTGTVNGLVPTNITSTLTIIGTGTEYLQLSVSATNAQITSSSFSVSAVAPSPIPVIQGQPPTSFDFCTHVIVNGTAFRVIGNGSLVFTPYEAWRFAKAMPTPDSMPYDSYYSWRAGLT
jgi:hypothetical protein